VNELLARLTHTAVNDSTSTNRTLDADPATFPLGAPIYADFSHDNQMVAIYAALGLFPADEKAMDPLHAAADRAWRASKLVPFSARMVTERLQCGAGSERESGTYVRVLVNDAIQPLGNCEGAKNGICLLKSFVQSQSYAREGAHKDWEKCVAESSR
jgi:hypothetical protein